MHLISIFTFLMSSMVMYRSNSDHNVLCRDILFRIKRNLGPFWSLLGPFWQVPRSLKFLTFVNILVAALWLFCMCWCRPRRPWLRRELCLNSPNRQLSCREISSVSCCQCHLECSLTVWTKIRSEVLLVCIVNQTVRECKPGGYFSNPGLRVWRPPNPGTWVWLCPWRQ